MPMTMNIQGDDDDDDDDDDDYDYDNVANVADYTAFALDRDPIRCQI